MLPNCIYGFPLLFILHMQFTAFSSSLLFHLQLHLQNHLQLYLHLILASYPRRPLAFAARLPTHTKILSNNFLHNSPTCTNEATFSFPFEENAICALLNARGVHEPRPSLASSPSTLVAYPLMVKTALASEKLRLTNS